MELLTRCISDQKQREASVAYKGPYCGFTPPETFDVYVKPTSESSLRELWPTSGRGTMVHRLIYAKVRHKNRTHMHLALM
jgi:hypothetical protein